MKKISISEFKTPFGELIIGEFEGEICLCDWKYRKMRSQIDSKIKNAFKADFFPEETTIIRECKTQLKSYFSQKLTIFDLPLIAVGSPFQQEVWKCLLQIPFGKTMSYLDLSKKLNKEKAIRAVASANGANPIAIIIPCHRVIGSSGELTGYAGGLNAKKQLLILENSNFDNQLNLF
jgi:methylated-DNA-[protein]-cysteine S-methyltransferase